MALDNTFTKWLYYGINWNFKEWYVIRETIPNYEACWFREYKQIKCCGYKSKKIDFTKVKVEPLFEDYVDFDKFCECDFRTVKVKSCEEVPKSNKLLKFTLDDGTENERTILSGIKSFYSPDELVGKALVAITNLPPRKMMGVESCGMLISAIYEYEGEERLNLLMIDDNIPAGAKLS